MNRLYFFANFGDWKKQPYGGGEVGNRRTLSLLRKFNFSTIVIEKYQRVPSHSVCNMILLLLKMIANILKFGTKLLVGHRKHSLVHIVGFYGPMVYFEYVLVSIARFLGYKLIYEMRGGGAELYYDEGSGLYRKTFSKLIKKSDCIFSQGKENYSLINLISANKEIFYYPNYVTTDFQPSVCLVKPKGRINLLYFGRVSKTKNIDVVIDVFEKLVEKYNNVYLDIVGNCPEQSYATEVKTKISQLKYAERVKMYPACNHEELKKHLSDKHFYLFPTHEPHEGHSNALTEAMAWGVIPIATRQGFNRSVIGDDSLIVSDLKVENFVSILCRIIEHDEIEKLSKQVYERIKNNYTDKVVSDNLEKEYEKLFP